MKTRKSQDDPQANCLPFGIPRGAPYPWRMVQTPTHKSATHIFILYEGNIHSYRQIFIGKEHPKDIYPTWYGDSVGHWEGDQLIVDTIGFNGNIWLDMAGHPASEQLHVIERFSRPNYGNLVNHITIEDPMMYTKPWDIIQNTPIMEAELMEYICTENERDSKHLDALKPK